MICRAVKHILFRNCFSPAYLSFPAVCKPPLHLLELFFLPSVLRWRTPANLAAIMACTMLGLATHAQRRALIFCPILVADMIRRQTNTALVFQVASLLQGFAKVPRQQAAINAWPEQHMCLIAANNVQRHIRIHPCGCRHCTATTLGYRKRLT